MQTTPHPLHPPYPRDRLGRTPLVVLLLLTAGAMLGAGVDRLAPAQPPAVRRMIMMHASDPGSPNYEAVMAIAEFPPGAATGRHRHPGVELGYVLEGSEILEHEGMAPDTLKAGDTFTNTGVHNARNPGASPAKVLVVYLVEKGKPLAEPVP